jgi:predicted DsbA family dithiol-disulfide isomerase
MSMRIDVWSDLVCPWCYIGKRRLERALADFPHHSEVEVVHRAFQLNPGMPKNATKDRGVHLMAKYGWSESQLRQIDAQMTRTAAQDGLEYHLAGTVTGNTFDGHQLLHLAMARDLQDAVLERLYRAYFTEQRSLFDRESLVAVVDEAGLDASEARRALDGDLYSNAVMADLQEARALGVTGVPFFVLDGRYGVSGAQAVSVFTDALSQAWNTRTPLHA